MAAGQLLRLSFPRFFNKPPAEIVTMPFLRAFLFLTVSAAAALAQTASTPLSPGLSRGGEVVMMQPIPDAGGNQPGVRPSRLRVLPAADHDLFARAFEAAGRGDWKTARPSRSAC